MNVVRMAAVAAVAAVALAGCGSASVDELVSDRYDVSANCRAAGLTGLGKLYSCQTGGSTTLCVMVDGDDVFSGLAEAQRVGIAC